MCLEALVPVHAHVTCYSTQAYFIKIWNTLARGRNDSSIFGGKMAASTTGVWHLQSKVPVQTIPNAFGCVNVFDKYAKRQQIGQGTYGEVWLAQDKETDEYVAIKKMKVDGQKEKRQGFPVTAIREIRVLQRLKHENLVQLREVSRSNGACRPANTCVLCSRPSCLWRIESSAPDILRFAAFVSNGFKGSVYLAFEFAEHDLCGLHERLKRNSAENEMPASLTKRFFYQLLSAVEYCHKQGVLHRDLKSSNVLITNCLLYTSPSPRD